jgi:hypothetical protein
MEPPGAEGCPGASMWLLEPILGGGEILVREPGKGKGGQTGRAGGPIAAFPARDASGHGVNIGAM